MPVSILVATPHTAFGELLRLSLEDNKQYQVQLVFSGQEARTFGAQTSYQLAILDADLHDEPFVPLCYDLLDQQKGIRLIIIPPENNPNHPALGGLMPHGYLNRPFYLPDLLETVSRLLNQRNIEPNNKNLPLSYTLPPWLQEPLTLHGYLEKELAHTQALAGFVGINGPQPGNGDLRASAGRLGDAAAQELAGVIFRYWNRDEKTDLMRFIRLASEKADYLVYATQITGDLVLIMVFDTGAPLSQIRPQTKSVAQSLATLPPEGYRLVANPANENDISFPGEEQANFSKDNDIKNIRAAFEPETQPLDDPQYIGDNHANDSIRSLNTDDMVDVISPMENPHPETQHYFKSDEFDGVASLDEDETVINLSALLGSIPSPDPELNQEETAAPPLPVGWDIELAPAWIPDQMGSNEPESSLADRTDRSGFESNGTAQLDAEDEVVNVFLPTANEGLNEKMTLSINLPERAIDPLEDTRPRLVSAITKINQLEPISPALALLNYTCVLVPRLPQHYLTGELADQLSAWVQHLCLAFGWRLEGIAVRPDYLQWTVQVAPSISPGNLVRIIRQRTSHQIFTNFQQLQEQNPSGDFWAIGYLIVSGSQPPSAQLLRDYISQTRKRQGIGRNGS